MHFIELILCLLPERKPIQNMGATKFLALNLKGKKKSFLGSHMFSNVSNISTITAICPHNSQVSSGVKSLERHRQTEDMNYFC